MTPMTCHTEQEHNSDAVQTQCRYASTISSAYGNNVASSFYKWYRRSVRSNESGSSRSHSLALSEANDWDYDKQRLWQSHEKEPESEDEKPSAESSRRTSVTMKDMMNKDSGRTTQLVFGMQGGKRVPKLKEPRSLYCVPRDVILPRWPVGIDTICPKPVHTHAHIPPPFVEDFYKKPSGTNFRLLEKVDTDKREGIVVYQLPLMRFPFYTRSRPTAALTSGEYPLDKYDDDILRFESRFECGNLFRARKVGPHEYELELRWDYFTMKHTQWFYFRVSNTRAGPTYKITIINLLKSGSLYNEGMKPLFYSEKNAKTKNLGWIRMGHNIHYYKNNVRRKDCKGERYQYSLTWQVQFPHTGDVCYFAHCYPYGYTDLQKDLLEIANDAVKSQYVKQRILCHSLGGNMVHLLTVTTPSSHLAEAKQKRAVVMTARVHPGETNSSWMMKGFVDFITGASPDAKVLRDNFVFKIVPMLNPDGVIVGNYRSSLAARDLNRNYKNPIKDAYPSIWSVKAMIRRMLTEREVVLYCDLHGHSRKMNVFMYGCENKDPTMRLQERVFPNMMGRNTSKFKYTSCRFKVQKKKEGTGRIVMWQQMGIMNSFTMEATFAGYNNIHFNSRDLEDMGYHFCDTLLDYCDPDPSKVQHVLANLTRIVKAQYAAKLGKNVDELQDIPLEELDFSDLESSDGGSDSSVSDGPPKLPLLKKKCAPLQPKKKYKTRKERNQIHRQSKRHNPRSPNSNTKSSNNPSTSETSAKKERLSKIKTVRSGSLSSTESPSVIAARQVHGIPKHAQERIEERQAKVNKSEEELENGDHGNYGDHGDLDNQSDSTYQELAESGTMFLQNGTYRTSSRDIDSPTIAAPRKRSPSYINDHRMSLEPAKVAFSNKDVPTTPSVYAVFEPTQEEEELDENGIQMSVLLSGVGASYQHDTPTDWTHEPDTVSGKTSPYAVNYRNNDVNSHRLGKNSFAIRPTKSAHRANRSKQILPCTKSDIVSYSDNPAQTQDVRTTVAMASPIHTSPIMTNNMIHNHSMTHIASNSTVNHIIHGNRSQINHINETKQIQQTLRTVQSWHSTIKPSVKQVDAEQPLTKRPDTRELVHVMSYRTIAQNEQDKQKKEKIGGNFTGNYVDKILKTKRHSVPKETHQPKEATEVIDPPPRRHRSLVSLQNKQNNNCKIVEKKMKQNSISWDNVCPVKNTPASQTSYMKLSIKERVSPWAQVTATLHKNKIHNKVGRLGFRPHAL